jgi:hypothetical protein
VEVLLTLWMTLLAMAAPRYLLMSVAESTATQLIVFVGSIYQDPATSYTVDGGYNITFTSAPPNTVPINVIHTTN